MSPEVEKWLLKYMLDRLNQCWGWSPGRKAALKRASMGWCIDALGSFEGWRCEECATGPLRRDLRQVDHIIPRGKRPTTLQELPEYAERTIVEEDKLRVLCLPCHSVHTKRQAGERAKKKREAKKK